MSDPINLIKSNTKKMKSNNNITCVLGHRQNGLHSKFKNDHLKLRELAEDKVATYRMEETIL